MTCTEHEAYLLGRDALDKGDYATAYDLYNKNKSKDMLCVYGLYILSQTGFIEDISEMVSITKSFERSIGSISELAEGDDIEAKFTLGVLCERGVVPQTADRSAETLYLEAYRAGSSRAGFNLAVLYQERNDAISVNKAIEIYDSLAKTGLSEAAFNLGYIYLNNSDFKDIDKAVRCFETAVELNDANGCMQLGIMYEKGIGVAKDLKKAEEYYLLAKKIGANK